MFNAAALYTYVCMYIVLYPDNNNQVDVQARQTMILQQKNIMFRS